MTACDRICRDPGPGRECHCRAAQGFAFASDDWCNCVCHRQTVAEMLDARDTQILSLRARLVDTEYALASVIAGIEAGGDPLALAAVAREQGGHGWVEKALRIGNTEPVRES